tara:strand:+ start:139 stop:372 length:234 start_codon:yes stop_codon:yes gene_type:complete
MNYNKIINYCNKYNIKRYTDLGKPLTHNKLKNIINDHTNKKHNLTQNQKIYNSIKQYIEDDIDFSTLSNAMHHYIVN